MTDEIESGIVLEDDRLPGNAFFEFCEDLLLRYEQDQRVMCVSGNYFCLRVGETGNTATRDEPAHDSYYFTNYMHCWGWATWRRDWQNDCPELSNHGGASDIVVIQNDPTSTAETKYWRKRFQRVLQGRINTWDYGWQHAIWKHSGLIAAPNVNLVDNIGFGADATHTAGGSTDQLPAKANWQIKSHTKSVSQSVSADRIEARHGYGFGERSIWRAAGLELQQVWNRHQRPKRAA